MPPKRQADAGPFGEPGEAWSLLGPSFEPRGSVKNKWDDQEWRMARREVYSQLMKDEIYKRQKLSGTPAFEALWKMTKPKMELVKSENPNAGSAHDTPAPEDAGEPAGEEYGQPPAWIPPGSFGDAAGADGGDGDDGDGGDGDDRDDNEGPAGDDPPEEEEEEQKEEEEAPANPADDGAPAPEGTTGDGSNGDGSNGDGSNQWHPWRVDATAAETTEDGSNQWRNWRTWNHGGGKGGGGAGRGSRPLWATQRPKGKGRGRGKGCASGKGRGKANFHVDRWGGRYVEGGYIDISGVFWPCLICMLVSAVKHGHGC